jgi:hypothetical protein
MKAFFKTAGLVVLCIIGGTIVLIWWFNDEASLSRALLFVLVPVGIWYALTEFVTKPIQADIQALHERLNELEGYDPPKPPPSPFG